MDKTIFPAWERAFPRENTLFEAWERRIVEMYGLETAFPPTLTPGSSNIAVKFVLFRHFYVHPRWIPAESAAGSTSCPPPPSVQLAALSVL